MEKPKEPLIVFALIERILQVLKESGATLEQSQAAVKSVEALLPVAEFQSRNHVTVHHARVG